MILMKDIVREGHIELRKIAKPKRKKKKHIKFQCKLEDERLLKKLENGEKITDSEIRKALSKLTQTGSEQEDGLGGI